MKFTLCTAKSQATEELFKSIQLFSMTVTFVEESTFGTQSLKSKCIRNSICQQLQCP